MATFSRVACGFAHTMVLSRDGELHTCGRGNSGQLGHGTRQHRDTMTALPYDLREARAVVAGFHHAAVLRADGVVMLWGHNSNGQLGDGSAQDQLVPTLLGPPNFWCAKVAMVACGGRHTLLVTDAGLVFAFGLGENGRLGLGDNHARQVPAYIEPSFFHQEKIAGIAAGARHSGVVTTHGTVFMWGYGDHGSLGFPSSGDQLRPMRLLPGFCNACALYAGSLHTMVRTATGQVWAWGGNDYGQLGLGDTKKRYVPHRIEALAHAKIREVACGQFHTLAVDEDRVVWSWGRGDSGALGHGDTAVSEDGALYTWGRAEYEANVPSGLGHGTRDDILVPTKVVLFGSE